MPYYLCAVPPCPSVSCYFRGICCVSGRPSRALLSRSCFVLPILLHVAKKKVVVHMCTRENVLKSEITHA